MTTMNRRAAPAPPNKRNKWRVYGPGDDFQDWPSENKAYEFVRSLTAKGEAASVYVWDVYPRTEQWVHFEDVLPVGIAREQG